MLFQSVGDMTHFYTHTGTIFSTLSTDYTALQNKTNHVYLFELYDWFLLIKPLAVNIGGSSSKPAESQKTITHFLGSNDIFRPFLGLIMLNKPKN